MLSFKQAANTTRNSSCQIQYKQQIWIFLLKYKLRQIKPSQGLSKHQLNSWEHTLLFLLFLLDEEEENKKAATTKEESETSESEEEDESEVRDF